MGLRYPGGFISASYNPAAANPAPLPILVEALVIAGGGAGGRFYGCGGGAGGLLYGFVQLAPATNYTVTIGAGGAYVDVSPIKGQNGTNSVFIGTAIGGGGGGANATNGGNGGSGGGNNGVSTQTGSNGLAGFGNGGGTARSTGGGGSGAGVTGTNRPGGTGRAYSISGSSVDYAAGGSGEGAASQPAGAGNFPNKGGGGVGDANTNWSYDPAFSPGNGGSGVVIISYSSLVPDLSSIDVGLTYTRTTSGGKTIYTFTAGTGNIRW